MARITSWLVVVALLLCTSRLAAQSEEGLAAAQGEAMPGPEPATGEAPPLLGDEQALQEERTPEERFRETTDPYEDPKKLYYFVGAGWRFVSLPAGLLKAYTIKGPSQFTPAAVFGEVAFRRKGYQVGVNVGYVKLTFEDAFRQKSDPVEDTEWLDTKFNFLVATASLTWSTSFTDWFQLEYGLEAGLAFIFGEMIRSEAVKQDGKWSKCETWASQMGYVNPRFRNPTREEQLYCDIPIGEPPPDTNAADEDGAHYGVSAKRGAFKKGIPYALPVLGPRLSLRFKPIAQLVLRVDVPLPIIPFGIMGGVSAQYGF